MTPRTTPDGGWSSAGSVAPDDALRTEAPSRRAPQRRLPAAGVFAIALTGFCAFLSLYATQPILPLLESLFHVSEAAAGLTVSAGTAAVALSAPVVGVLADRVTRKRIIVLALFALAVPTFLAATSRGLGDLVVWRFLQGALVPGVYVPVLAYITEEAGARSVGVVMAAFVTGNVLGGLAGRVLSGVIAAHAGWREGFVVLGLINIAGAFASWRWLVPSRNFTPRQAPALTRRERAVHLREPRLLATYVIGFNILFALVATFSYVTFHLNDAPFHLGPAALSGVFIVYLVGAVVTPVAGSWVDRIGSRRVLIASLLIGAAGMLLTLAPSLPLVVVGLAICCTSCFANQSATTSYLRVAAPAPVRSLASGVYVTWYYVGGSVGGILPGLLWPRAGWTGCVALVIAAMLGTAAVAWWRW